MTLKSAPFLEVVAEVRWTPDAAVSPQAIDPTNTILQQVAFDNANSFESFFAKFEAIVQNLGFSHTERLLPMGFPIVAHQPVCRVREDSTKSKIYQVGVGIFSAHAIAPYKSWHDFAPDIKKGIEALLQAREGSEAGAAFNSISLRYLDAFTDIHSSGRKTAQFLDEVLKLKMVLPPALANLIQDEGVVTPHYRFQIPLKDGLVMRVSVGDGKVKNQSATIMETVVATTIPTAANTEAVMEALESAHKIINAMFFELVAPIRHLLDSNSGE